MTETSADSHPLHPDDAAVAEVRAWLPEGTPDHALIELEAHTLRGVLAVLDGWKQNTYTAAAQRNAAEGRLQTAKVDMQMLRDDLAAAIARAEKTEARFAELGEPETQWATRTPNITGHRYHPDDETMCRRRAAVTYGPPHELVQRTIYPTPWQPVGESRSDNDE